MSEPVYEEHCRPGRRQQNGFKEQRWCDEENVQMFRENTGALTFPTGRECICVFRTNRTLMRPRDEGRFLWPAYDKGRGLDPPLVFKTVFLG
ncbi:hypothetical protein TNCV_2742871 [Trichonephila clavipes]|nr:hypothetical protein TNCV_2742871 [Trichonephila clavipes]